MTAAADFPWVVTLTQPGLKSIKRFAGEDEAKAFADKFRVNLEAITRSAPDAARIGAAGFRITGPHHIPTPLPEETSHAD